MSKAQVNVRLSDAGKMKLNKLTEIYGTQTSAVEVAIDRMYQQEFPQEETMTGNFTINEDKLDEVVSIFNRDTDPQATDEIIKAEIVADWNEGDEHQQWINDASPAEIADWLASFYQ